MAVLLSEIEQLIGLDASLLQDKVRIPTLSGRSFQFEAGHHSDVKPATIPINVRPL